MPSADYWFSLGWRSQSTETPPSQKTIHLVSSHLSFSTMIQLLLCYSFLSIFYIGGDQEWGGLGDHEDLHHQHHQHPVDQEGLKGGETVKASRLQLCLSRHQLSQRVGSSANVSLRMKSIGLNLIILYHLYISVQQTNKQTSCYMKIHPETCLIFPQELLDSSCH